MSLDIEKIESMVEDIIKRLNFLTARLELAKLNDPRVAIMYDWCDIDKDSPLLSMVGDEIHTKYGESGTITGFDRDSNGKVTTVIFNDGEMERSVSIEKISI